MSEGPELRCPVCGSNRIRPIMAAGSETVLVSLAAVDAAGELMALPVRLMSCQVCGAVLPFLSTSRFVAERRPSEG